MQTKTTSARSDWPIIAGLLVLTAIPAVAGSVRLASLAGGAEITPENARFFASPLPVILHIISVTLFCVLGAFQFAPGFRRRRPGWHRMVGRVLMVAGLVSALSGLWMTHFYPLHGQQLQGGLLYGFRLLIGSAMVGCVGLSWAAIMRRDFARHRAWIIRGYAIGQGAGTQAFVMLPWMLIFGISSELTRDILMIASWLINLAFAEWIIRRPRRSRADRPAAGGRLSPVGDR
ncbi:MAG TPA: DUF2306 domain-containing protein [Herpetosiphonaceae bacterium]|nr:DUF2306 domain-containing protein [Herpetosiphonaceae bacterium]